MTSERSQAYGRVASTLSELGPVKLHDDELDRLREAADTLLFSEDINDEAAASAISDARGILDHLVDTGRWTEERAGRLGDDLGACGPLAHVA